MKRDEFVDQAACNGYFLRLVREDAMRLAETLRDASDAGVSPALIMPQLVVVFKEAFGAPPAGFTLPQIPA